jgi:hypothetical protein
MQTVPEVPFMPDDPDYRIAFLGSTMFEALPRLGDEQQPLWGRMTPHQMVEHLLWAFELATGAAICECLVPEERRQLYRPFITNERRNQRNVPNPALATGLPPLRYPDLRTSLAVLRSEVGVFLEIWSSSPATARIHPMLGPMDMEEWSRVLYKHCFHHLSQFSLVTEPSVPM